MVISPPLLYYKLSFRSALLPILSYARFYWKRSYHYHRRMSALQSGDLLTMPCILLSCIAKRWSNSYCFKNCNKFIHKNASWVLCGLSQLVTLMHRVSVDTWKAVRYRLYNCHAIALEQQLLRHLMENLICKPKPDFQFDLVEEPDRTWGRRKLSTPAGELW